MKGKNVTLFPVLNGYSKWLLKADELSYITTFKVSNLLETIATAKESEKGLDLADYLIHIPNQTIPSPFN